MKLSFLSLVLHEMQNFNDFGPKSTLRTVRFFTRLERNAFSDLLKNKLGFRGDMLYGWAAWLGMAALGGSGLLWAALG